MKTDAIPITRNSAVLNAEIRVVPMVVIQRKMVVLTLCDCGRTLH